MIFEDPSRRRWKLTLVVSALLSTVILATIGLAVAGMLMPPEVPDLFAERPWVRAATIEKSMRANIEAPFKEAPSSQLTKRRATERRRRDRIVHEAKGGALPLPPHSVIGFTLWDDPASVASLEKHFTSIDVVVPDLFAFSGPKCELKEYESVLIQRVVRRAKLLSLPRLVNFIGNEWHGEGAARLMRSPAQRKCLIDKVVARLLAIDADGINIDIEALAPEDSEAFLQFLVEMRVALHAYGLRLSVDVAPYDPAYDIEFIGRIADAVFVMAYDEHFPSSAPGAVASRRWFSDVLRDLGAHVPPERLVIVLGAYGYDWIVEEPQPPAESFAFRNGMSTAKAAGVFPEFVKDIENTRFAYRDYNNRLHEVWVQDALSTWNQWKVLQEKRISRVGLWRLGTEDGTIWEFLGQRSSEVSSKQLRTVPSTSDLELFGEGEVIAIRSEPEKGLRELQVDAQDRVISATYKRVPSGFVLERRGGKPKQVVLTFDDGPDPKWTGKILDALNEQKVPGTFFVLGANAAQYPSLIERVVRKNHFLGNHSYSHPHMELLTPREALVELSVTQRLIQGITGEPTPFFRPPYVVDVDPERPEDLAPLREGFEEGYVFVGAKVDPADWQRPGVQTLVNRIVEGVTSKRGQVVLLHDGGGDRSQTVEAIRKVVPQLRSRGYKFVSLDTYLGVSRSDIRTKMPLHERMLAWGDVNLARIRGMAWSVLATLFFVCTLLSIGRILFLGVLALRDLRRRVPIDSSSSYKPVVTVLIPAYNESKVIGTTLSSVLASDYDAIEVMVIDDGSTDDTVAVVEAIAVKDHRVRCIRQKNEGKASAANRGISEATGEIVIAVDADTLISSDAVSKLVRHFSNPEVTAVCGNVEVGNVNGVLTAFQAIEYVTSQNFDRRAFSVLNCVSVVPGALGAWRRKEMLRVGGYSHDTLTEDADLTLTILRQGGRIVYEPEATGRTEAPETLRAFLRQRFRWTFGTYQCLSKHRAAFGKGTLGWVGLPNMVLFQIIFPALSPIGDIVMALSIIQGEWSAFLAGYLAFLFMDLCGSLLAFVLDRKPVKWLALLIIQRFTYRQLMYYVSFRALVAALRGARHGWRKLDRTGTVGLPNRTPQRPTPKDESRLEA